jgi:hypothetical protein
MIDSTFYANLFPVLTPNRPRPIVADTAFGLYVTGVSASSDFAPFLAAMELAADRYVMPYVGSVIEFHLGNRHVEKLFKRVVCHYTVVHGLMDRLLTISEAGLVTAQVQGVQQADVTRWKIRLYAAICAADVCLDALMTALAPLEPTLLPTSEFVKSLRDVEAIVNCDSSYLTYCALLPYISRREATQAHRATTHPVAEAAIRSIVVAQGAIDFLETNPVLKFPRGIRILSNMEHNNNTTDVQTIRNQAIARQIAQLREVIVMWESKLQTKARSQVNMIAQGNVIGIHRKR